MNPLVSINIPTLNSQSTLEETLKSIKNQTYKKIEIIIVDGNSNDSTEKIAKKYKAKFFVDKGKLLGARHLGVEKSKGEIIVLLDSDQVLERTIIERAVEMMKNYDMIFLEEDSYNPRTTIEKLTSIDRKIIHKIRVIEPDKGVLLPRVFKRSLLIKVFDKIDPKLYNIVVLQDHAIIYYESYKISKKVGYLENAVYHMELKTARELFKHYFAWGVRGNKKIGEMPEEYRKMFDSRLKNRNKSVEFGFNFLKVLPIVLIKGLGYYSGLIYSRFNK